MDNLYRASPRIVSPYTILVKAKPTSHRPLPIETLETIFILCACEYHTEADGDCIPTPPSWVNVSYVCRQWRNIALSCATLWTYLFNTSPRWTEVLLARSKQVSLKLKAVVYYEDGQYRGLRFFKQVIKHMCRIQELHLLIGMSRPETVLSELSSRAPRLQLLKISGEGFYSKEFPPLLLFDGDTPALRTLDLEDCSVSRYSLNLTCLTTLHLGRSYNGVVLNLPDFLATLRRMHGLRHLYLHNVSASAAGFLSSTSFYSFKKINLPHLSRLSIGSQLSMMVALLSCINLPSGTIVKLDQGCYDEEHPLVDDYTTLYSLLAQRHGVSIKDQVTSHLTIRSLGIECNMPTTVTLYFCTSERDPIISTPGTEWRREVPLQIGLCLRQQTFSDDERVISRACCSMPLSNVQSVDFVGPLNFPAFWTDVLGHCGNLRHIKLSDDCAPNLASILFHIPCNSAENQVGRVDRGQSHMAVPMLEELELHNVSFSTSATRNMDPFEIIDVQSLQDALSARKESRGRLTLTHCFECGLDCQNRRIDMEGWWGDGRFRTVSYREVIYY